MKFRLNNQILLSTSLGKVKLKNSKVSKEFQKLINIIINVGV